MKHERVRVRAQLRNDEGHTMAHQAADEMHVAGEPVELRHQHGAFRLPGVRERRRKLGTALKRVGTLASLNFGALAN